MQAIVFTNGSPLKVENPSLKVLESFMRVGADGALVKEDRLTLLLENGKNGSYPLVLNFDDDDEARLLGRLLSRTAEKRKKGNTNGNGLSGAPLGATH